jgi:hypothetical protein
MASPKRKVTRSCRSLTCLGECPAFADLNEASVLSSLSWRGSSLRLWSRWTRQGQDGLPFVAHGAGNELGGRGWAARPPSGAAEGEPHEERPRRACCLTLRSWAGRVDASSSTFVAGTALGELVPGLQGISSGSTLLSCAQVTAHSRQIASTEVVGGTGR